MSESSLLEACVGLAAAGEAVLAVGGGSSMFTAAEAFRSTEVLRLGAQEATKSLRKKGKETEIEDVEIV